MHYRVIALIYFIFFYKCAFSQAVFSFRLDTTTTVTKVGAPLKMPFAGGLNSAVFCQIDLNGDGHNDLLVLDRVGNRLSTFLFNPSSINLKYDYAPSYISLLPPLHDWVSSYDFDCDGDLDLFTYFNNSIGVWKNEFSVGSGLSFSLFTNQINSQYASGMAPIFSTQVNLSAFTDVDNDGDMDILTFTNSGNFIEYHKNYSMDSLGTCGQFIFKVEPDCWGHFRLSGLTNSALLNQNCLTNREIEKESHLHSGSVLTVIDQGCDGDVDIINGDILGSNLLYLENGGTADSAYITLQDSVFPNYNVNVNLQNLPAAFYFDGDGDAVKDLIVTPFATVGEDLRNVNFYKNTGTNCQNTFSYVKNNFLVEEMIDVGTSANVSFFDVNGDGKKDLVIGNDYAYNANPVLQYSSISVYLNTSIGSQTSFDFLTSDWMNLSSLAQYGLSPAFGDLDGDGDDDLLLGNADGTLIYFKNTSSGSIPNFIFTSPNFQSIDVGNNSMPQIIDVDRDGKLDLIIGERSGVLNYYKNIGSGGALSFVNVSSNFGGLNVSAINSITGYSAPLMFDNGNGYELFVASESGLIYHYNNIENNLAGSFNLIDSNYQDINEPKRATIALDDYNQDGKKDFIVGNGAGGVRAYLNTTSNFTSENLADFDFEILPNPSVQNTPLFIKLPTNCRNANLKIFNVIGQQVYSQELTGRFSVIDNLILSKGEYLVSIDFAGRTFTKKLIRL